MAEFTTNAPMITQALADALLAALSAVPGGALMITPKVHLATNGRTPTPADTPASWTEAAFAGYAAQALVWSAPVHLSPVQEGVVSNVTFVAGAVTASVNVFGYYVTDTTGAILYLAEQFPNGPVGFSTAGDFLLITLAFPENELRQVLGGVA